MKNNPSLLHITDVGASSGNGVDSVLRIRNQYRRLGIEAEIITAGQSPLHVAFAGTTTLHPQAGERADELLKILGKESPEIQLIALNCAPRNKKICGGNGQEDYIYRIKKFGPEQNIENTYLLYGPEVLKYAVNFLGENRVKIDKILAIKNLIPDTSNGSQFRSAEHLPIVHALELWGKLDEYGKKEVVNPFAIPKIFSKNQNEVLITPHDEFKNGRLVVQRELAERILASQRVKIQEILEEQIEVANSLTNVIPDRIAIWPSSNHFPNPELTVLNIGTRWSNGQTSTTNPKVIQLAEQLSTRVGQIYSVEFE